MLDWATTAEQNLMTWQMLNNTDTSEQKFNDKKKKIL